MKEKTEYQTITLKGSNEKYTCDQIEYPILYANIFYIKFIVYKKIEGTMTPTEFLTVQPQDILSRTYNYDNAHEEILIENAKIATEQMEEHQKKIENDYTNPDYTHKIEQADSMWS